MSIEVKVPALGESITEATVADWKVKEGDFVELDAPLVDLETDKVVVTVPAPANGLVTAILKHKDEAVLIGTVLAYFEKAERPATSAQPGAAAVASPASVSHPTESAGLHLSPAVKRIVDEKGLDPSTLTPTGPKGNLVKADVLGLAAAPMPAPAPKTASAAPSIPRPPAAAAPSRADEEELVPMNMLRRRIAERLVQVQNTAAILTTFNEVDVSAIQDARKRFRDAFVKKYSVKIGYMSFFVKAMVEALKAFPALNAEIRGDNIVYKRGYHIGVAVGGGRGLIVPVVRNCDRLSFAEIENEILRLSERARNNTLTIDELTGGTFTISNGGIYGSMMSTPILNPPQSGILGMHNIVDRAVVIDGNVVVRPMMYLALSYDHRIVDGREAVQCLVRVKQCLEAPERILLEV